nr:ATP-binding protein [uncultured Draconibacterium sp.]
MFAKLKMAKADGSYLKELAKIEHQHLVIIDDFGLQLLDNPNRLDMSFHYLRTATKWQLLYKQHLRGLTHLSFLHVV